MITRRDFLGTATAAAVAVSMTNDATGQTQTADCVDAHVHVWTPDLKKFPISSEFTKSDMVPASFTPEELFEHTRPAGVSRIVLIQMSFYKFDNRYMLSVIDQYPGTFAGVAIVDENRVDTPAEMKSLRGKGVLGFRLYADKAKAQAWQTSDGMKAMWATAADSGQAMCLLADPDALPLVDAMCQRYPRTRVVIDHFARIGMTGEIVSSDLDNLCRLAKFPNVYVKTSAFYALGAKQAPYTDLVPMILRLVKEFGAARLMWASDCPYQVQGNHTYAASIGLIRDHLPNLTAEQRASLLRETATKLFFT
jgi:predicted TIM-barrel fold metal-dependent hydrolase